MAKYSLVMISTPCRVAACIISTRPTYNALVDLVTYVLLTYMYMYTVVSGRIKPEYLQTVEDRAKTKAYTSYNGL